ncbi:MAG: hypothetical protein ABR913_00820, partial [Sedimentisphaerales bacterium]
ESNRERFVENAYIIRLSKPQECNGGLPMPLKELPFGTATYFCYPLPLNRKSEPPNPARALAR